MIEIDFMPEDEFDKRSDMIRGALEGLPPMSAVAILMAWVSGVVDEIPDVNDWRAARYALLCACRLKFDDRE